MKKVAELIKNKHWAAAEERLQAIKANKPFDPQVLFNLGFVLKQLNRRDEALQFFRQCVHVAPDHVPALVNLSYLLEQQGDLRQAIRYAQMAVKKAPNDGERHQHLSILWSHLRNPDYALEANTHALALRPQAVDWRIHRMRLLAFMERKDEALAEARRILTFPEHAENLDAFLVINEILSSRSDWHGLSNLKESLNRAVARPLAKASPTLLMMTFDDPGLINRLGQNYAEAMIPKRSPHFKPGHNVGESQPRMVLGYFTSDAREHPVAQMLIEVLSRHDRTRFEVVLVRLTPLDTSDIGQEVHKRIDRTLDLTHDSDTQAVEKIRASGIDILIDLMGLTAGNRLPILAARACRAQVLWLGCPVSTGTNLYDAFLVDDQVAPAGYEQFCTEPLLRLPCCYHPISVGLNPVRSTASRHELGIPSDVVVIGMLQQSNRIRPEFAEKVARVLAAHPQVHLMLRVSIDARPAVSARLAEWGIPADRVHFFKRLEQRSEYLRLTELLDLVIDSHPYGGHSTTGEALALGTPVLASAGSSIHARVAASMMHDLGLLDLVSNSVEEQMATLDQLLSEPEKLVEWKRRFAEAASQSAEARHMRLTRALENAYATTLAQADAGQLTGTTLNANSISGNAPDA